MKEMFQTTYGIGGCDGSKTNSLRNGPTFRARPRLRSNCQYQRPIFKLPVFFHQNSGRWLRAMIIVVCTFTFLIYILILSCCTAVDELLNAVQPMSGHYVIFLFVSSDDSIDATEPPLKSAVWGIYSHAWLRLSSWDKQTRQYIGLCVSFVVLTGADRGRVHYSYVGLTSGQTRGSLDGISVDPRHRY